MQLFSLLATALTAATAVAKSGPVNVAYVEVNDNAIGNAGKYTLDDGSPAFDLAIIFAANINAKDGGGAVLYNNDHVQGVLNDAANQIRPLQDKGIKVVLSVLGNHQAAGICNFQSQDAATDFANQLHDTVQQYGLDGIDFDDEYVTYGSNGVPGINDQSIGWLLTALRNVMPDKLITFYNFGPAAQQMANAPESVGSTLNYAWNGAYGSYQAPTIAGLGRDRVSAAAVDYGTVSDSAAAGLASQTKNDGYGVFLTYGLPGDDKSAYISGITQALYGQNTHFSG